MAKLTQEQEKMVYQQIINLIRQKLNDNQTLRNKISDGIWEKLGYKPYNKQTLDKLGQNESSDDEYKDNFNQIFQSALCENKNDKLQLREGVKVQIKQILTSIYNGQMFKQSNGSFESLFKDNEVDKAVDKLLNNSDFVTNPYNSVQVIFDDFKNIQNINVYNYKYEPEISKNKVNYVSLYDQFERFPDSEGSNKTFLGVLKDQYARILNQPYTTSISHSESLPKDRTKKLDAIYAIFEKVRDRQPISPQHLAILKENTGLGKNIGLNAESYNALYQHAKDYQVKTTLSLLAKDETNGFNFNDIDDPKRNYNNYQKDALKTIKSIYTEVIEKHFDDKIIAKDLNKDQKDGLSFSFSGEESIEKSQENPQETSLCKLANKIANKEKVEANDYKILSQKQQDQLKKPIDKFNTYSVNLKDDLIAKLKDRKDDIFNEIEKKWENPNNSHLSNRISGLKDMQEALAYNDGTGYYNPKFMQKLLDDGNDKVLRHYNVNLQRGNGFLGWHYGATTGYKNLDEALTRFKNRDDASQLNKAIKSEMYRLEPGYKKIAEIEKVISKLEHGGAISAEDKRGLYENRTSIIWGEFTSKTKEKMDHLIEAYNNESVQNKRLENAG
ncbi:MULTISPECIES: hypothetical protein [Cysteiniphilum]|uniref:hypothetical protein n=2 Tax=Fastidiosibacteraceae TaxID=2056687 RepID=UPI00177FFA9F|nr:MULTISPECIES: hypothetical protein [Cysteiniphilum]